VAQARGELDVAELVEALGLLVVQVVVVPVVAAVNRARFIVELRVEQHKPNDLRRALRGVICADPVGEAGAEQAQPVRAPLRSWTLARATRMLLRIAASVSSSYRPSLSPYLPRSKRREATRAAVSPVARRAKNPPSSLVTPRRRLPGPLPSPARERRVRRTCPQVAVRRACESARDSRWAWLSSPRDRRCPDPSSTWLPCVGPRLFQDRNILLHVGPLPNRPAPSKS
jgi:hypothetical protein